MSRQFSSHKIIKAGTKTGQFRLEYYTIINDSMFYSESEGWSNLNRKKYL